MAVGRHAAARVWLFDLDNTLHNASASAFRHLDRSMTDYIQRELSVDLAEANRLRSLYWRRYGATLLGLVRHHNVNPAHFLHHTHLLPDLERDLKWQAEDLAALRRLPGRRLVLTNAPLAYAERVLAAMGIRSWFEEVISIEQMSLFGQLRPKPDVRMFRALAARLKVAPRDCVLVEDTLIHQKAAYAVGMRTVWMQRWAKRHGHGPESGLRLCRKPVYVCARIRSLQQLHRVLR
jgi:putative hydrolase of the HAD superfamily